MKKPKNVLVGALLFVALFAFAFGLAYVSPAQAGPDYCCEIPSTPFCSAGVGYWSVVYQQCFYCPDSTQCELQVAPECW